MGGQFACAKVHAKQDNPTPIGTSSLTVYPAKAWLSAIPKLPPADSRAQFRRRDQVQYGANTVFPPQR